MKNLSIKILYSVNYFDRDLFALSINGLHTMVYRASGTNGGRKGRIIPFTGLKDNLPRFSEAINGIGPGYIYKDFFYNKAYVSHRKRFDFYDGVPEFLLYLEDFLKDEKPRILEEDFEDILSIAIKRNKEIADAIESVENIFDWSSLNKNKDLN